MPSQAFTNFRKNIIDTDKLIEAHSILHNGNRGKTGLGHITRSGIVMLCATWELYIESLLLESLNILLTRKNHPRDLPLTIQKSLSKFIRKDTHELKPIELAGDGWRQTFYQYAHNETELLNTPKSGKLDELYLRYLGLENFSSQWTTLAADLDQFVSKRGEIAHLGRQAKYVYIRELIADRGIIYNLVSEVDQILLDYIISLDPTLHQPWRRTY